MSLTIDHIRKRHAELSNLLKQKLTAQNVDEFYEKDVGDLLRMNEALLKTCCQLNMKWHEAAGKEPLEFKTYWDNYNRAVDKLLVRHVILKVDG
ncbi:hypothetical protein LCGC14_1214800 [marine sediment metagenome]|uniref:Uncharacterized protein n=1 Tax=marine sediment metagenome TaxID=412755 RepID=A0A0F9NVC4_9ZZZZ